MNIIDDYDITNAKHRRLKPYTKKRKFDYAEFIAWDGEGITDANGHHLYIYLASSSGDSICSPTGISSDDALALLISVAEQHPKAIHVGYFFSYDINMILKDLPYSALERIVSGRRCYYNQYNIEVRFGKRLWVKDRSTGVSITLWDVGSFFQQSFIKALETWEVATDFLENIRNMKASRSLFDLSQLDEIKAYCQQELDSLVLLMKAFRNALDVCNLRIGQWHGPGAIAEFLYKRHGMKQHMCKAPEHINIAAQVAYGGGRIELIKQGSYRGPVYYYDIRSAYPYAISQLPSLKHGTWLLSTDANPECRELSLYHVSHWSFDTLDPFFPIRHRASTGDISYPEKGNGCWIWSPEYELLKDFYPGTYEVDKAFIYCNPKGGIRPFSWVGQLYNQRNEWKANGNPAERGLKLGLNSLYGKMIQQQGWRLRDDGTVQLPAFHQLEWGGYVTSSCRAQLYRAANRNPNAIVGFETDGIISIEPLDVVLSNELGGWDMEQYNGVTYVQNGFYWLHTDNGTIKSKYRGFDPGTVTEDAILNAWANGEEYVEATLTRHYGLGIAMHHRRMDRWGDWVTEPRKLSTLVPITKRLANCNGVRNCDACNANLGKHEALHQTSAYGWAMDESYPYPLEWKGERPLWKQEIDEFNKLEACDYEEIYASV